MKKFLALLLTLFAASASAQSTVVGGGGGVSSGSAVSGCTINSIVYIDGSGNLACGGAPAPLYSGGTVTFSNGVAAVSPFIVMDNVTPVLTVADGGATTFASTITAAATNGYKFAGSGEASLGWFSGGLLVQANTSSQYALYNTLTRVSWARDAAVGWTSSATDASGTVDTVFGREAAATVQFGADVNGAAVAQTLKAHDGITGTDIAGATFTLAGGRGTGAGAGGNFRIQTSIPVGTGTTAQALADRELFVATNRAVADNTATTLFTITLGDDTDGGGIVDFCAMATSATTDRQKTCGLIAFSGVDVTSGAGGETCSAAITGTNSTSVSVGTLTVTAAATTGTDLCNIRITSDSSLNVAHTVRYSVRLHPSASTVVITPQ